MKAENWELLNGMGFGERTINDRPYEVEVPGFMYETSYSVLVPASAYRAQGTGRVKRQVRAEKKLRRDFMNGLVYTVAAFGLLVVAINLAEWLF